MVLKINTLSGMQQSVLLVKALKQALRRQGMTYAQVAQALKLSEATVKRMFARQKFTLQRLEQISQLLGLEFVDLLQLLSEQQQLTTALTEQQELELTEDLSLLLIAFLVLHYWTLEQILQWYQLTKTECIQKLIKLERMQLISLLPENRIKLKISPHFQWRDNGPMQRFFQQQLATEFLANPTQPQPEMLVLNGMLSLNSRQQFQARLQRLKRDFYEFTEQDKYLPFEQRFGVSTIILMRDWRFGLFKRFLKADKLG